MAMAPSLPLVGVLVLLAFCLPFCAEEEEEDASLCLALILDDDSSPIPSLLLTPWRPLKPPPLPPLIPCCFVSLVPPPDPVPLSLSLVKGMFPLPYLNPTWFTGVKGE